MTTGLQGPQGDPGPAGPPASWWALLLTQLPAILTAAAGCIGAWAAFSASSNNAARLEQHGEQLQKVETDLGQVDRKIERPAPLSVPVVIPVPVKGP